MNPATSSAQDAQLRQVQAAFSKQSPVFDALDEEPLVQWVRERVREAVMPHIRSGDRLLDINCGTGIDSLWFAEHGLRVTATDHAPGMLDQLIRKLARVPELAVDAKACSFLELDRLPSAGYDAVFSNFGGINCTEHLGTVLRGVDHCLRPGGVCALVIMPRFSPWELVEFFRGHVRYAFRRYRTGGALAFVEGVPFQCYYHDLRDVRSALPAYALVDRLTLSFFVPPPHLGPFGARHPRLVRLLAAMERSCCRWPFIRSRGDHYMVILRKPS
jgi:ubiquinone/menaquinone biosynthesis C-methylase UbiE